MLKTLSLFMVGLFLIGLVSAIDTITYEVAPSAVDADVYSPPSSSNTEDHGKGSKGHKEKCLTQWITKDGRKWDKRNLLSINKYGRTVVISGERCNLNENLNQARRNWNTGYLQPLYTNSSPMWPSLLWK